MSTKPRIEAVLLPRIDVTREDFAGWYKQVLVKGDMVDYHDSSIQVHIPDAGYSIQGGSCNGLGQN